ncbi:TIR domain-containing protein [Enterococcus faecalis]|nr:TIR domain-containing protein [Enterococcus faecalis]EHA7757547.1 TIR domain-containing protein [Enterococcus faecalis]EKQ3637836.1 TIR domain-containing protein [Enterococcus faecalis]
MVKRQVFFSFEYKKDNWRAGQIKNMGIVDGSSTFSSNEWEEVKEKSDQKIKEWIDSQLDKRSCIVVLVGTTTASRKWVKYEFEKAYQLNKGIVGIYAHNLKDVLGNQATKGTNPFYNIFTNNGSRLSSYVTCYESSYATSTYVYNDIEEKLPNLIENAILNKAPK